MRTSRIAAFGAAIFVGVTLLAGCQPALPTADDASVGVGVSTDANGQVIDPNAPVLISPDMGKATAPVGALLTFDVAAEDLLTTTITSDNEAVLQVFPASSGGGMLTPATAIVQAPGTAKITIKGPTGPAKTVVLTVTQ
jgi:hypothetical protein